MELRIATCRPLPEPDPDEEPLLEALAAVGIASRMTAWNDPEEQWDAGVPTIIRSTWDYIHDVAGFLAWASRVAAAGPLWNSLDVIAGNVHKRYLLELAARGVSTTPTVLVLSSERPDLARTCVERGWDDIVVKPAVGASSFGTLRFVGDEIPGGQAHLDSLLGASDVLVQPYLDSVDDHGERALVWIDGTFTHAVRKSPRFSGGDEQVSDAIPIDPDDWALADRALASIAHNLLYARVDVARDARGNPVVMELELVEPSLFLLQCPAALARLVGAIAHRLGR